MTEKFDAAMRDAQLMGRDEDCLARSELDEPTRKLLWSCRAEIRCLYRQLTGGDPSCNMGSVGAVLKRIAVALGETSERHMHVAGTGKDIDTCAQCGEDIRSEIHLRMGERP